MRRYEKMAMIFGVVAMLGLSLLLCFASSKKNDMFSNRTEQCSTMQEP